MSDPIARARGELAQRGFACLRGLLPPDALAELAAAIDAAAAPAARDMASAGDERARGTQIERENWLRTRPDLRATRAYALCREAASRLAGRPLRALYDHTIVKRAGSPVETPWHQDQAYMGRFVRLDSLHFWIPLQPTDAASGGLQFLPHPRRRLVPHRRVACVDGSRLLAAESCDGAGTVAPAFAAGDVSVHRPDTLHHSGPNTSGADRRVWIVHFNRWGRLAYLRPRNALGKAVAELAARRA